MLTLIEISCDEISQVRTYPADSAGWRAAWRDFQALVREDLQAAEETRDAAAEADIENYLQSRFPATWPPSGNWRYRQGDRDHAGSPEYQVFLWASTTDGESPARTKAFKVATVSDNLDTFGNRGHVLVAADAQAFEVSRPLAANCGGGFQDYTVGDVVELLVCGEAIRDWARYRFSHVRPLRPMPPNLLSMFWPPAKTPTQE